MKVGVACGGTGGHTFPGLATAAELRRRGHAVVLWLAGQAVERAAVAGWDGPVARVPAVGFPGGLSWRLAPAALRAALAVLRCAARMRRDRPDVLLAMGSYASVGPVLAARAWRVPVVLHEANAVPGRAVARLARFAAAVGVAFEVPAGVFGAARVVPTGLPVRPAVLGPGEPLLPPGGGFTVLVMGGSQGAHRLNEVAAEALARLCAAGVPVRAVHLTGQTDEEAVRGRYAAAGMPAVVAAFRQDMASVYASADVAVCRSGAASCTELMLREVPAILVPYPYAMGNHQLANARQVCARGGAELLEERDLDAARLADRLRALAGDPGRLAAMRAALRGGAPADAATRLAELVEEVGVHPARARTPRQARRS